MRLGSAWHALMERAALPDETPWTPAQLARRFALTTEEAAQAFAAAQRVQSAPELRRFFARATDAPGADAPLRADAELELIDADGSVVRIDRLVEFAQDCWILDYKWQLPTESLPAYRAQVERYRRVLQSTGFQKPLRLLLIAADAQTLEVP